ncbi:malate:quinone oxidoreductase [Actinobacillus pleuropneumoniae]|nr:malate:quinone oxidoreductase [Actinobacillus pleuropneumoniae]
MIRAEDGSLAALLGASPGASTSVKAMLDVLVSCFAAELPQWQAKLTQMLPSYGKALRNEPQLYAQIKQRVDQVLALAN